MILAVVGGMFLPWQTGVNMELSGRLGSSVLAALASFCVGGLALLSYALLTKVNWPQWNTLAAVPWKYWTGGLAGAFIVWVSIVAGPKIGATLLVACILAGQAAASLIVDHYGWLGFPVHEASWGRLAGCLLLIGGVILIRKY